MFDPLAVPIRFPLIQTVSASSPVVQIVAEVGEQAGPAAQLLTEKQKRTNPLVMNKKETNFILFKVRSMEYLTNF